MLNLSENGHYPIPLEKHPKILDVLLDQSLNFAEDCKRTPAKDLCMKVSLKALSGTTCGKSKEMVLVTYKASVRPTLNYVCRAWLHAASYTSLSKFHVVQKAAFCTNWLHKIECSRIFAFRMQNFFVAHHHQLLTLNIYLP